MGTKIIAICQLGGEFVADKDGIRSYRGGSAHATDIDDEMTFNEFRIEVGEMFNCSIDSMSIKYFLPGNKKTPITVSNDKDLNRMIKFHGNSLTADLYIIMEEVLPHDISNMPGRRSSTTTLSETIIPIDGPLAMVDDTTQPDIPLVAPLDILEDTNHDDTQINMLSEISPSFPLLSSNDENHGKGAQQWQNI